MTPQHVAALDNAKFEIFLKNDGAFLGSLMCNMDIEFDPTCPTAKTDGKTIKFNPDWFMGLPENTRPTILLHELWHVGLLHCIRGVGFEPRRYNRAADYAINIMLHDEGNSFDGAGGLLDPAYRSMSAEDIYDLLPNDPKDQKAQQGCFSDDPDDNDLGKPENASDAEEMVQLVHAATIAQQRSGYSSDRVEAIASLIRARNEPMVNWKAELQVFAQEKAKAGLDYNRRNRRYSHVILPARGKRGRLVELDFYFDVSGSVTDAMIEQMTSEIVYIHGVLKPKRLNLIQFDTHIRRIQTFTEGTPVNEIDIIGRGGTSLHEVADRLEKVKPTGAIIMTDLDCAPMRLVENVPVLWLCINNKSAQVNQGKLIHIQV